MSAPHSNDSLIAFPCRFPIKVMGRAAPTFETHIALLVREHAPDLAPEDVNLRPSQAGNYVSITLTVNATSRAQLDAIYHALSARDDVLMAL